MLLGLAYAVCVYTGFWAFVLCCLCYVLSATRTIWFYWYATCDAFFCFIDLFRLFTTQLIKKFRGLQVTSALVARARNLVPFFLYYLLLFCFGYFGLFV